MSRVRQPSPRQQQIAQLVAEEGLTYQEVSDRLGIARGTVQRHANSVGSLMGMKPRDALIEWHRAKEVPRKASSLPKRPRRPIDDGSDEFDDPTPVEFGGATITKRQMEVAELVARGLRYRDIGRRLGGISEKTVSTHVQAICAAAGRGRSIGARQFVTQWYNEARLGAVEDPDGPSIYFIQAENGLIKIGVSENVTRRLESLQAMSPLELELIGTCPGDYRAEGRLHERFREYATKGEWFEPCDELLATIEELTVGGAT